MLQCRRSLLVHLSLLGCLLCLYGCGGPSVTRITGKVTGSDGQPVSGASIKFKWEDGNERVAVVEKGEFSLTDVPPGKVQVAFAIPKLSAASTSGSYAKHMQDAKKSAPPEAANKVQDDTAEKVKNVPQRYLVYQTAGLHKEIEAGKNNEFEFSLSK